MKVRAKMGTKDMRAELSTWGLLACVLFGLGSTNDSAAAVGATLRSGAAAGESVLRVLSRPSRTLVSQFRQQRMDMFKVIIELDGFAKAMNFEHLRRNSGRRPLSSNAMDAIVRYQTAVTEQLLKTFEPFVSHREKADEGEQFMAAQLSRILDNDDVPNHVRDEVARMHAKLVGLMTTLKTIVAKAEYEKGLTKRWNKKVRAFSHLRGRDIDTYSHFGRRWLDRVTLGRTTDRSPGVDIEEIWEKEIYATFSAFEQSGLEADEMEAVDRLRQYLFAFMKVNERAASEDPLEAAQAQQLVVVLREHIEAHIRHRVDQLPVARIGGQQEETFRQRMRLERAVGAERDRILEANVSPVAGDGETQALAVIDDSSSARTFDPDAEVTVDLLEQALDARGGAGANPSGD